MDNKTELLTDLLRDLSTDLNGISDDLTRMYPYIEIDDAGLPYGNKRIIKDIIIHLKYRSYTITKEILND